jgi:hypothetical protein
VRNRIERPRRVSGAARLVWTLALCAAAGALPGSSAAVTTQAGCTQGPTTVGGASAHAFCGPAKATVHVAGKTYHFKQGACLKSEGFTKGSKVLSINIGTETLPPAAPKRAYFGVLLDKAKGGTFTDQAVSWQVPGRGFAVFNNKVVVAATLKKGSFSGKATMRVNNGKLKEVGLATGTWTC